MEYASIKEIAAALNEGNIKLQGLSFEDVDGVECLVNPTREQIQQFILGSDANFLRGCIDQHGSIILVDGWRYTHNDIDRVFSVQWHLATMLPDNEQTTFDIFPPEHSPSSHRDYSGDLPSCLQGSFATQTIPLIGG